MAISKEQTHDLIKTGDPDATASICDRNGEVVLAYCRRCRKGEGELGSTCDGRVVGAYTAAATARPDDGSDAAYASVARSGGDGGDGSAKGRGTGGKL